MTPTNVTTIAMPPQDFWGLVFVAGLILCTGLIYLALAQLGKPYRAPEWERLPTIGIALLVPLAILWAALFLLTIWAAFWGTYQLLNPPPPGQTPASSLGALGLGTLLAGLLGAPFLIWGTILKHRTVGFQKEGHLTERISKAVEQLGAEKRVDRIGRPVTLLSGHSVMLTKRTGSEMSPDLEPNERYVELLGEDIDEDGYHWRHSVRRWPDKRTVIEWRGETLRIGSLEEVQEQGAWQAFAETLPNIEVRIGGILSLERIAQDSTAYDKGRDHVRVMEILCSYVRENAKREKLGDGMSEFVGEYYKLPEPRVDIQIALTAIGRRQERQIALEAEQRYRLDLRNCDLRRADLTKAALAGALFTDSNLDGAIFDHADLTGTRFFKCRMALTRFTNARIVGTRFDAAVSERTGSWFAGFIGGVGFKSAFLQGAKLQGFLFDRALFRENRTFGTNDTDLSSVLDEEKQKQLASVDRRYMQSIDASESAEEEAEGSEWLTSIEKSGFNYWSPFTSNDFANGELMKPFISAHGLHDWPHTDQ